MSFSDVLKQLEQSKRKKLEKKIPQWAEVQGIECPELLSLEQCSSAPTAKFKAQLIEYIFENHRQFKDKAEEAKEKACQSISDLTGGLGVDSWALSEVTQWIHYYERDEKLGELARRNFERIGIKNIECSVAQVDAELLEGISKQDCIYIDPARRSESGKKVFLIEDCTPDVLGLMDVLKRKCRFLLLKFSPMADISMLVKRLGGPAFKVLSVGVVGIKHEVKEILVLMGSEEVALPKIFIADANDGAIVAKKDVENLLGFKAFDGIALEGKKETEEKTLKIEDKKDLESKQMTHILLEPDSIITKSGFLGGRKQLYTIDLNTQDTISKITTLGILQFFKAFEIEQCLTYSKENLKFLSRNYPVAEVSSIGLAISSEELSKKLGCKSGINPDGNHYHIFATETRNGKCLVVGKKINAPESCTSYSEASKKG